MPDRVAELRRQHALLSEHLRWLERELANAEETTRPGSAGRAPLPPVKHSITPLAPSPADPTRIPPSAGGTDIEGRTEGAAAASSDPATAVAGDAILERYRVPPAALRQDVRKGCVMYFLVAFFLLIGGTLALYYVLSVK